MKTLIGIDYGSDSVRAVLVGTNGDELATCTFEYPRWAEGKYCNPSISQFRQHPLDYLEGLEAVVKGVLKGQDASLVTAIGIDTTGSTPGAVNSKGIPLALLPEFAEDPDAMFILWKDHTGKQEADRLTEIAKNWGGPDYTQFEGGIYSSEWIWSKALHILKTNPRVRKEAWKFVEHCDWLPSLLTGRPVKASRCAAGLKAMWHASWKGLPSEEYLTTVDPLLAGMRERMYTDSYTADTPVGTLTPMWAQKLGLSSDVVVSVGILDASAGALGSGFADGVLVKIVGTSTCDIVGAANCIQCLSGICGQVDGAVMPGLINLEAGQSSFGDAYAWLKRFLEYGGQSVDLRDLEKEAAALESDSVIALDWFNGRRSPFENPQVSSGFWGLNLGTTAPMLYRAIVQATAFGSRAIDEHLRKCGVAIRSIRACGGIARKSPFVMQTLADALNQEVHIVQSDQTCALGAAINAATAAKLFPNAQEASDAIASPVEKSFVPRRNYDALYQKYLRLAKFVEEESTR